MNLSYDEIRRIHRLEKNTSQLVEVEAGFYNELYEFMKREKEKYLSSLKDFSISGSKDFTNLKKMVEEIFAMREKKILAQALIASRTKDASNIIMTMQEKELFKKILLLLEDHEKILGKLFSESPFGADSEIVLETLPVKIVSDIPSFIGSDMKEYGPFKKDQSVELPLKVAKLLSQRNLAIVNEMVVS